MHALSGVRTHNRSTRATKTHPLSRTATVIGNSVDWIQLTVPRFCRSIGITTSKCMVASRPAQPCVGVGIC